MNTYSIELDLSKEPRDAQTVFIRQGEAGSTTIHFTITDHGEPFDVSGYTVYFRMRYPHGATLQETVEGVSGSEFDYTLTSRAANEVGTAQIAYLELMQGSDAGALVLTTGAFAIVSLPNAEGNPDAVSDAYVSRIEQMLKDAWDDINAAVKKAEDAAANINAGVVGLLDIITITDAEIDEMWAAHKPKEV